MARRFVAARSQYIQYAGAPVTTAPATLACWFRVPSAGNAALVSLNNSGTANNDLSLRLNATGAVLASWSTSWR